MVETSPGKFSLMLVAGTTDVDEVIEELGHEPNGYFWEGIASRSCWSTPRHRALKALRV